MALFWTALIVGINIVNAVMSDFDPDISNGTCYYKENEQADDAYAPAGNAAIGHVFCCQLGDKLNQNNSCAAVLEGGVVYTYVAGCTDPTYRHDSCPNKNNYTDYQWVGLVFCQGQDLWVGCENDQSVTPSISKESSGCTCDVNTQYDPDAPIFQAPQGLVALGNLPDSQGEKIDWESGEGPVYDSTASSSIATATSSSTSTPAQTLPAPTTGDPTTASSSRTDSAESTAAATPTATASAVSPTGSSASNITAASGNGGLSNGVKVGIGVSAAAVGVIALSAILYAVYRRFRKRQKKNNRDLNGFGADSKKSPQGEPTIPDIGEADLRSPAWSGHKSELPGSPTDVPVANHSVDSASTIVNSPSWSSMANTSPRQSSEQPVYRPFRYQPSKTLEGIQEMPDHERPRWARTEYGTYGPNRGYNVDHDRMMQARGSGANAGDNNVHELPG